jgi:hypothetical protein
MKKAEFLLEVKTELDNIKANATKEEIGRLNIESFNVNSPTRCIYGLMTGECFSNRAKELSPKIYDNVGWGNSFTQQSFIKNKMECFTALEKYLYMVKAPTHAKIIEYLKGTINVLVLK